MKTFVVAIALAGATLTAHAQFSSSNGVVTDSISGASWLDISYTAGKTYNDVVVQLDTTFAGYRVATYEEMAQLFVDASFWINQPLYESTDPARMAANKSFFEAFNGVSSSTTGLEVVAGMFYRSPEMVASSPALPMWSGLVVNSGNHVSTASTDAFGTLASTSNPSFGTWLIASPVPEPQTYALMLIGLATLGIAVKRRKVG